ncbi:MAG: hypothetical protein AAGB34_11250, partial [Planctomycetota bacterium]
NVGKTLNEIHTTDVALGRFLQRWRLLGSMSLRMPFGSPDGLVVCLVRTRGGVCTAMAVRITPRRASMDRVELGCLPWFSFSFSLVAEPLPRDSLIIKSTRHLELQKREAAELYAKRGDVGLVLKSSYTLRNRPWFKGVRRVLFDAGVVHDEYEDAACFVTFLCRSRGGCCVAAAMGKHP